MVTGDEDALEQVLLNLLVNAVNHTSPDGTIAVTAKRARGGIRLEVTDDGEGIDPELQPRLFDRFVRADGARRRETGGTGLGLAICRSIVEEHGGRIWAENATGRRRAVRHRAAGAAHRRHKTCLISLSRLIHRALLRWDAGTPTSRTPTQQPRRTQCHSQRP